jgi:DNA-binding CsgD family transcriptional regulator
VVLSKDACGRGALLLGRDDEQRVLAEALDSARRGRSRALVVTGDPGMGKTELLRAAMAAAGDCHVLTVAGVESESTLAFAGLHRLLVPHLGGLAQLPPRQRDAVRVAFGELASSRDDRLLVGLGILTLLAELARERPVVCVIDDVHWLDHESVQALGFIARRLHADRMAMLFAIRTSSDRAPLLADLDPVVIDGLPGDAAAALVQRQVAGALDPAVEHRIVAETQGCPLAIVEMTQELSAAQLAGERALPEMLPLGRRMEAHFTRRIAVLPEDTRTWLLILAAEQSDDAGRRRHVASELGLDPAADAAAVDAGLIEPGLRARFRHPLIRSAVYASAPAALRRRVHRSLADATDAGADPDRHAWHLAASVTSPDEAIAAVMERAARVVAARGGRQAASALLVRASELSPRPSDRGRRLLAAAEEALRAAQPSQSAALLEAAGATIDSAYLRACAQRLEGRVQISLFRGGQAFAQFLAAAASMADVDPDEARSTMLEAIDAFLGAGAGAIGQTSTDVGRAALAHRAGDPSSLPNLLLTAIGHLYTTAFEDAAPHLRVAVHAYLDESVAALDRARFAYLAIFLCEELWDDDLLRRVTTALQSAADDHGMLIPAISAPSASAMVALRAGDFRRAQVLYEHAAGVMVAAGGSRARAPLLDIQLRAWRADPDVREAIDQLIALADGSGAQGARERALLSLATLELGLGNYPEALDAARRLAAGTLHLRTHGLALVVEAAVRSGQLDAANEALDALQRRAAGARTALAASVLERARGLVAQGPEAEAHFAQSLELISTAPRSTEAARTRLVYGEWLRREKRRTDAREQLREAHAAFAAMGARAYAERAHRELLATGGRARKRRDDTANDLTPQERTVAQLAAAGATNQEIAGRLYLSASTVDYHLGKVYRKLAVRSRRDLRRMFPGAVDGPRPARHSSHLDVDADR